MEGLARSCSKAGSMCVKLTVKGFVIDCYRKVDAINRLCAQGVIDGIKYPDSSLETTNFARISCKDKNIKVVKNLTLFGSLRMLSGSSVMTGHCG